MFIIKRNQIVVTALAVMVGTAGYLNFQEGQRIDSMKTALELSEEGDITAVITDYNTIPDDVIAENITVNNLADNNLSLDSLTAEIVSFEDIKESSNSENNVETSVLEMAETTGDGVAVFVNADTLASSNIQFFAEAKLDREQARSKQKDILTDMIDNQNVSQEQKDLCGNQLIQIQERIEKETSSESMIKSKGFNEAYVRIDDETVDVVVDRENLSQAEIAQIEDIVKRKTGFEADKIRINSLKSE